ncbi:PAS domain S-box protein, partial [Patescibacteria group bacterium]|nr:PAS domain S-box protein [Patescibacteria group bacterium]
MEIKNPTPEQNKIAVLLDDLSSLESYARDLFSFLPLPVCLVSSIGIILETNPALEKISGYSTEELIGNPLENFIGKLDANRLIKETLEKGSLSSREIVLTTKDKKKIYVSASTLLRKNDQGETIGCFMGLFDLTAIKENEQDLHKSQSALLNILEDVVEEKGKAEEEKNKTSAVIANLTDGLMVFDSQNNLSLINPPAEKLLRVKKDAVYNKSPDELASLTDSFKPLLTILGKEIKEIFRQEIIIEDFTLEISSVSIGASKNRTGSLIIVHDITREKGIERMKTEFVSIAAHQLRTPLSVIKWALSLLLEGDVGELSAEQKNVIGKSYTSNERMITLINDLLDVARIEEGRYLYKLVTAKLENLAQAALSSCREIAAKRNIKLEYQKPAKALPELMIDAEKITFAIQNLVENAIKYTPPGGQVTVSLKYDTNKVALSVKDTGVGISQEQQNRLFTKFFRANNIMRMETDGTGLGLFIAKNIIEAHG